PRHFRPFPTRRSSDLHPGAPRPGRVRAHAGRHRGGALRGSRAGVLLLALATAAACGQLGPALDQVVALSVAVRDSIEELDTLRPDRKSTRLNSSHVAI